MAHTWTPIKLFGATVAHTWTPIKPVPACLQVIVTALLQQWGISGFEDFLLKLQALYTHKSAVAAAAATQHLTGLATWEPCSAGMFMWLRLTSGRDLSTVMDQVRHNAKALSVRVAGYVDQNANCD